MVRPPPPDSAARKRVADPTSDETDQRTGGGGSTELVASELVLRYPGTDEPVINGESISAVPGAVTALVGPNASGKSTLLKGLARQLAPEHGTVLLDGRDVYRLGTKEFARHLGLLSQERSIPDSITVEDLAFHGRYPHRGFFDNVTDEDRAAVDRAIRLAGVDHLREREMGSLSGGQKQLAWIAMILAQETEVLLLDEPTTFLDLHHQLEVMEIVETLRDESAITVVLVLHDIEQAARYADYLVALRDGTVQAHGPPAEVVTEELLAEVFRVDAEVAETAQGLRITPICARHDDEAVPEDDPEDGTR